MSIIVVEFGNNQDREGDESVPDPATYLGTQEFPWSILATPATHHCDFKVWREVGWDVNGDPALRMYDEVDDGTKPPIDQYTTDRERAEVYLHGFIKWDHCSNWHFDAQEDIALHFCGVDDIRTLAKLFDRLYELAEELVSHWIDRGD